MILERVSQYWSCKNSITDDAKEKIKSFVKGEIVGELHDFEGRRLLKADGETFHTVFSLNRQYLYKGEFTASPDDNDYSRSLNYLTEDGLGGFAVSEGGWLTSFYSNYECGGFARAVKDHLLRDVKKLVCIVADGTDTLAGDAKGLVRLYGEAFGFVPCARTLDDTHIMREYYGDEYIDYFLEKNGRPYHLFMIAGGASCAAEIRCFEDYFTAERFVEELV